MRLFVSVDVDELATEIRTIQQPVADASGLRLTDPEQAHLTLKFLGEVPDDAVPSLCVAVSEAVEASGVSPFRAAFGGLGVFPSLEYISVVWLGVREGHEELTRLHEAIETRTTELGFEPEEHAFTPHVTLARMDHAESKALVQRLVRERDPTAGHVVVDTVSLTRSTLTADGPVYETVEEFTLDT